MALMPEEPWAGTLHAFSPLLSLCRNPIWMNVTQLVWLHLQGIWREAWNTYQQTSRRHISPWRWLDRPPSAPAHPRSVVHSCTSPGNCSGDARGDSESTKESHAGTQTRALLTFHSGDGWALGCYCGTGVAGKWWEIVYSGGGAVYGQSHEGGGAGCCSTSLRSLLYSRSHCTLLPNSSRTVVDVIVEVVVIVVGVVGEFMRVPGEGEVGDMTRVPVSSKEEEEVIR